MRQPSINASKQSAEGQNAHAGLLFHSTLLMVYAAQGRGWEHIPDVERNRYCFTDGCGTVSPLLAREMAEMLWAQGRLQRGQLASAYQIRFSGVKGMIAVDPRLTDRRCEH